LLTKRSAQTRWQLSVDVPCRRQCPKKYFPIVQSFVELFVLAEFEAWKMPLFRYVHNKTRVARQFILRPKIPTSVYFGGP
jgi:hypothetical protein